MKFLPTSVHAVADYATGLIVLIVALMFTPPENSVAANILLAYAISLLAVSALTRYELGIVRVIPMSVHLIIDFAVGAFLIAAPWLFGFADVVWWPFVLLGVLEIGAALVTVPTPSFEGGRQADGTYTPPQSGLSRGGPR